MKRWKKKKENWWQKHEKVRKCRKKKCQQEGTENKNKMEEKKHKLKQKKTIQRKGGKCR